jgi:ElaB/YqjD/DUF883 family membrane-anchored ribosome-binding protein
MNLSNAEPASETAASSVADRVADTVRHVAHLSHEARLMKSMARDAGEEGVHAAKRVIRRVQRGVERIEDLGDDAVHVVKHRPLMAVGAAAGIGLAIGVVVGWIGRAGAHRRCRSHGDATT